LKDGRIDTIVQNDNNHLRLSEKEVGHATH
jgi:hypothetical protein